MAYRDLMNKIRYWDNLTAKWILRHFYFIFFEIFLVVIFFFWFVNTLKVIDVNLQIDKTQILERILMTQSFQTTIIVLLLILNSFWLLFIFNNLQRLITLMKDVNFNLNKMRQKNR